MFSQPVFKSEWAGRRNVWIVVEYCTILGEGKVPQPYSRDYDEAIPWIDEQVNKGPCIFARPNRRWKYRRRDLNQGCQRETYDVY